MVKNYTYDSADNTSAFSVQVGDETKLSLQYSYDGESKLTSVTDEQGNQVVEYSYDTDGNLAERTVSGNNLTTTYTYDYQNQLTAMKNQTGSAGIISEYSSEYLSNGQKFRETSDVVDKDGKKTAKTATYTYDLLGRITKETKTGSDDISYAYDSNNRKEMTVGNKVTAYKYNKNDELLRTDTLNTDTEEDSIVIYKYDKNGNQLATVNRYEIPNDRKDSTYVDIDVTLGDNRLNENVVNHYDALNQITQILTKNYKVSFTYDAEGLRTSKNVNGEKTVFIWNGDQLVMELSESGKVQKRYIRGNDLVYVDKGTDTEKQYYVTDPHENVVQLTDESGAVTKTYEYDSFGNEVDPDSKDDNPFRYCGEYYDKETEEIYLRARYYQPAVGRFLTRDTYTGEEDEPLSLHLYTYCESDGVNIVDSNGHWGHELGKGKLKEYKMTNVTDKYMEDYFYLYVHENITDKAVENLEADKTINIKSKLYNKLITGSVYPDRHKKDGKKILGIKISPESTFHGKVKKELNSLKKRVLKRVKEKGSAKKKYLLIGTVLHAIQDYNAHSYISDIEPIRKRVEKEKAKDIKIKSKKRRAFHKDWLSETKYNKKKEAEYYKFDQKKHNKFKDNVYYDFRKNTENNKVKYKWVKVTTRMENKRYIQALNQSMDYLKKAIKKMK